MSPRAVRAEPQSTRPRPLIVAGVMSGTSADGIDVALVRITPGSDDAAPPKLKLLGHRTVAYPRALRKAVLDAMNASSISVAELARLDWRLGEAYADAVETTCAELALTPALIGLHGQTIYHQADAAAYRGRPTRATWQIGEAAVVSARLHVPVVSDLRPADLAAGGQGAPLAPMLDVCLYRSPIINRILLNLGGIANLTAMPAKRTAGEVLAFDIGPANMVVDALMTDHFGKRFDRDGAVARSGSVDAAAVADCLSAPWFKKAPPKSCGREEFGRAYARQLSQACRNAAPRDVVATATELTAVSIRNAYEQFVKPYLDVHASSVQATELIVSGGGVRNLWLMQRLRQHFKAFAVRIRPIDETGMPAEAKEAAAFALLAWLRWHGLPGNIPAATGAQRPAVLGAVSLW